ncbi:CapA family protein [Paenibacillus allorhizosphaerae]|uniref:Capsule biosynthesis protein CapA n=1 Tax=Paenibacillus allorhizosphaerae TaxID=2849866 RepID=A0ABM8VI80_9BACL|nr:CapA family protein [Paenibacillus allorhizosphaerae]CAG7643828.1 Capsule biosynthesis protein CapA [Paenibacillus allorhizosphaerae]
MKITIAIVGDLLMKSEIISSAKQQSEYKFERIFSKVKPFLNKHDVTIGNLETTFSGTRKLGVVRKCPTGNCPNERRNPHTGRPVFNCPDELAAALKSTGFDVLTTANNHCMDGGAAGLKRTLAVLDKHGLRHTGTYRTFEESKRYLILHVKGVKIGVLSYTSGTNSISVPHRWMVNCINPNKMASDIRRLKDKTDFIIAYLHFGKEYRSSPTHKQKQLIHFLFKQGVNVVLGAHPHVLHPVSVSQERDIQGQLRRRVAASSLGNFVSTRLRNDKNTIRGKILILTLKKQQGGVTDVTKVEHMPTIVEQTVRKMGTFYRVVPDRSRDNA